MMAGHSKWANIKHRKAAQDKKRGKQFAKLIRAIESAAREAGSSDPTGSPSLALAVQKARDADVPKDNIERACRRGAGEDDGGARYEAATYEGYAPGGVAVLVDVLTDNRNRTASDVRSLFTRAGGSLAEPGAVSFLFAGVGRC
jgi:YebC/PmpR family DNA-binding regulatory protein